MKKNLTYVFCILIATLGCKQEAKQEAEGFNIVGKWKDENSIVEYLSDGNWNGTFNGNYQNKGSYVIKNDTLKMYFGNSMMDAVNYVFLKKGKNDFTIKSFGGKYNSSVFNKKRIK